MRHRYRLSDIRAARTPGQDVPCFNAVWPFGYSHIATFPLRCYVPSRARLSHSFQPNLTIWQNATALLFSRGYRYSPMTTGGIKTGLRIVFPIASFENDLTSGDDA